MDLFRDITEIVKSDREHHVEVKANSFGVTVYLIDDPLNECFEEYIIPITYSTLEECCYIPRNEFFEKFKECDTGIEFEEIVLIKRIMKYLQCNKVEINKLCEQLNWCDRIKTNVKNSENIDSWGEDEESHFPID